MVRQRSLPRFELSTDVRSRIGGKPQCLDRTRLQAEPLEPRLLLAVLQPGDANQDLYFDPADLILAQKGGKYLTGEFATWDEGDWNGAPGGAPGDPPLGDEVFDDLDLQLALDAKLFGIGPYDDEAGDPVTELKALNAGGVRGDEQTSIIYDALTGEVGVDVAAGNELTAIHIASSSGIFIGEPARNLGGVFDLDDDENIFKATFGESFGSLSFGNVAEPGLNEDDVLSDLSADGALLEVGGLGAVDLIYIGRARPPILQPGDANQDLHFDEADVVQVAKASKFQTGERARWEEGDWNGGPGGEPNNPPQGDGLFNQVDILAATRAGFYRTGAYAVVAGPAVSAIAPISSDGMVDDGQTSLVYNAFTGEISVDAPAGIELTAIHIVSPSGIFTGDPARNLGGVFDVDEDDTIFKATFGSSFGSISFGNVAQPDLSEGFIVTELQVDGALVGGGALGDVDLVYIGQQRLSGGFDARIELNEAVDIPPSDSQMNAERQLRAQVPDLLVSYNKDTGTARTAFNMTGYITGANAGDPETIALNFARANQDLLGLTAADLDNVQLSDSVRSNAPYLTATHLYWRQMHEGLSSYDGQLHVNVNQDGRIMSLNNSFMPNFAESVNTIQPQISPGEAVLRAARHIGIDIDVPPEELGPPAGVEQRTLVDNTGISEDQIEARLMLLPTQLGEVRLVWNFFITTPIDPDPHSYEFNVDAVNADVWTRLDFIAADTYRAYPLPKENPNRVIPAPPIDGRTDAVNVADVIASPFGWHDTDGLPGAEFNATRGNNVHAFTAIVPQAPSGGPALEFTFPIDLTLDPLTYREASVTNLFYWVNLVHDVSFQYGFDPASGNFQNNNYGLAPAASGNDAILAVGQNPSRCNAFFDFSPFGPQILTFLCDNNMDGLFTDGAFDNGVVVHEYAHGISSRLVGGPSVLNSLNNVTGQNIREGVSDLYALMFTHEVGDTGADSRGVGEYLFELLPGETIRPQHYSTDPAANTYTYETIQTIGGLHQVGSVWAQVAWEAYWALVDLYGFDPDLYNATGGSGNQRMLLYVTEGLKNTNSNPTFVDARNGIIQAALDNYGGVDACLIWETFAAFGLGANANAVGPNSLNVTNGFTNPCRDYGDAPDGALGTYPTLRSNDGARHLIVAGGPVLGGSVDGDLDGQVSASADGDDLSARNDEDGVDFLNALIPGATVTVEIEVSESNGFLNAWLDSNADGTWTSNEQIFTDTSLTTGVNTQMFTVPSDAISGATYARFRVTSANSNGLLGPNGDAMDGEVEDYIVTIVNAPVGPITDINGNSNTVAENSPIGAMVGVTAAAVDPSAGDTVTYALTDNAGGRFSIGANSGAITTAMMLDFEASSSHSITVRATSTDGSSSTRDFTISVTDQNDNAPVIAAGQSFSVVETAANTTGVGTVVASDADTVGSLQNWTITAGNTDGVFAVNANSGQITIAGNTSLDFEVTTSYLLTLTVSDGVNTSDPQTVSINVIDEPEGAGGIHGIVFEDINANGIRDVAESGLPNWTIVLTGQDDQGNLVGRSTTSLSDDPSTTGVNEAGFYRFENLNPGSYGIRTGVQDGWLQTFPGSPVALAGDANHDWTFDQRDVTQLHIQGKFAAGPGASLAEGDFDDDGDYDAADNALVLGNLGFYLTGNYSSSVAVPAQSVVLGAGQQVVSTPGQATLLPGQTEIVLGDTLVLGITELASIHGQKWLDENGNGTRDAGEPGLNGVVIRLLDENGDVVAVTTTGNMDLSPQDGVIDAASEKGQYLFEGVIPGDYTVEEEFGCPTSSCPNPGLRGTSPSGASHAVSLDSGSNQSNLDFGNAPLSLSPVDGFEIFPSPQFAPGGAFSFADLQTAHEFFLGTPDETITFDGLSGVIAPDQFSASHGVTFENLQGIGAASEGSVTIETVDGYDGSYQPDGNTVYASHPNHVNPLTIRFDTPVARVGSFVGAGMEGSVGTLTIAAFESTNSLIASYVTELGIFGDPSNREGFWAIRSDDANISSVTILNDNPTDFGNALIIDNLQWSTSPLVPSTPAVLYNSFTGQLELDVPDGVMLTSVDITSASGVFTGSAATNLGGPLDIDSDNRVFKTILGGSFGDVGFGPVATPGLTVDFLGSDLDVQGTRLGGGVLGEIDVLPQLQAGDANQNLIFDQNDIVQVLKAAKYLTGQPATWKEGDWDGAPGGRPGNPPLGDGVFDTLDIVAALDHGLYRTGPYAAARWAYSPVGDANRDGQFDQVDIDQVARVGKYLTGQTASWAEGDWNADGTFNQLDIVAALQRGSFAPLAPQPFRAEDAIDQVMSIWNATS